MKNFLHYAFVSTLILVLFSCSMGDSPKKTAGKFLESFNDRKFDEARKYSTPETIKLVDLMENLTKMAQSTDSVKPGKVEIMDERIEGEIAYVTFREEGSEESQELKLKKVDGKWLVHVTKEDVAAKDATHGEGETEEGMWSDQDSLPTESEPVLTE